MTTYPGPDAAYFSLFHSAPSMDNRAVRLSGVLSFLVAVACIVFAERYITEWVVRMPLVSCLEICPFTNTRTAVEVHVGIVDFHYKRVEYRRFGSSAFAFVGEVQGGNAIVVFFASSCLRTFSPAVSLDTLLVTYRVATKLPEGRSSVFPHFEALV